MWVIKRVVRRYIYVSERVVGDGKGWARLLWILWYKTWAVVGEKARLVGNNNILMWTCFRAGAGLRGPVHASDRSLNPAGRAKVPHRPRIPSNYQLNWSVLINPSF